ncbi:hypothetical protein EOL32_27970, partial [Citrobacter freundii]
NASIGFWMAVLVSAGILGQWPIGRLADKLGRLLVFIDLKQKSRVTFSRKISWITLTFISY